LLEVFQISKDTVRITSAIPVAHQDGGAGLQGERGGRDVPADITDIRGNFHGGVRIQTYREDIGHHVDVRDRDAHWRHPDIGFDFS
jgi:hypothetical protein